MSKLHNRKYLEERRKVLRNKSTSAEAVLWKSLQRKQSKGRKFRRQHSIGNYIVDFYCASENLVIELDGAVHLDFAQQNYDEQRTHLLEALGLKIIRFENKMVFESLELVLEVIASNFKN